MQEEDFQEIIDYMFFKGFDYPDLRQFLLYLDKFNSDFEFTEEVTKSLIKSNVQELDGFPEDVQEYKQSLISFIEEV